MGFSFRSLLHTTGCHVDSSLSRADVRAIRRLVEKQSVFGGGIMSIDPATADQIPSDCPQASPANSYIVVAGRMDAPLAGRGMRFLATRADTGFEIKPLGVWVS